MTVALTGGIACGKSTVAAIFERLGAYVIDADRIVHALLARGGAAVEHVVKEFGPEVAAPDGSIDRAALARLVFADDDVRSRIERILHPRVSREVFQTILDLAGEDEGGSIVVADIPLLFETGSEKIFDRVVAVVCREETQLERLAATRGMALPDARARLRAQAPTGEKARRSDWVIENEGTPAELERRAEQVFREIEETFERQREAGSLREPPGRRRF